MATITVTGGTLYAVAQQYLGDFNQWTVLAALNGLTDPWLQGVVTLRLPAGVSVGSAANGAG